jgi:hypothetical protein
LLWWALRYSLVIPGTVTATAAQAIINSVVVTAIITGAFLLANTYLTAWLARRHWPPTKPHRRRHHHHDGAGNERSD